MPPASSLSAISVTTTARGFGRSTPIRFLRLSMRVEGVMVCADSSGAASIRFAWVLDRPALWFTVSAPPFVITLSIIMLASTLVKGKMSRLRKYLQARL